MDSLRRYHGHSTMGLSNYEDVDGRAASYSCHAAGVLLYVMDVNGMHEERMIIRMAMQVCEFMQVCKPGELWTLRFTALGADQTHILESEYEHETPEPHTDKYARVCD